MRVLLVHGAGYAPTDAKWLLERPRLRAGLVAGTSRPKGSRSSTRSPATASTSLQDRLLGVPRRAPRTESQRLDTQPKPVAATALLHLIASLKVPTDRRFRHAWMSILHQVAFTHTPITRDERVGRQLERSGTLRIAHEGHEYRIACSGRHRTGLAYMDLGTGPDTARRPSSMSNTI
jgi:hypothetical protein